MNKLQYKIVKSVLAVGADPIKFAKMCNAEPMDFIKVQTTDNYDQYLESDDSIEDIIKGASDSIFGKGKK